MAHRRTNPQRTRRTHARLHGFSLVELAMVLTIMLIIAALAAPRYASALANYRARAAAHRIANDLALARAAARQTSQSRTVRFDLAASRLHIDQLTMTRGTTAPYTTALNAAPYHARLIQADLGGDARVVFDGFGVPDTGGSIVVEADGARCTVVLDPDSGGATLR